MCYSLFIVEVELSRLLSRPFPFVNLSLSVSETTTQQYSDSEESFTVALSPDDVAETEVHT